MIETKGSLALVTGATGFVGSAVLRSLLAEGLRVRALARPASPRANLDGLEVEIAEGDLSDQASLVRALTGVRFLFHVAADYRLWARNPEEIVSNNLSGTRAVMAVALKTGVERIVYTSSVATLGFRSDGSPSDETLPLTEREAIGAYKRSKVAAERLVERMIAEEGLPAVMVNPSTPIGPRDIKPTPTGRIIVEAATGKIPAFVDTGLNLVHVDDVAAGHLLALKHGDIGQRYILGGEDVSLRQMLTDIAALTGRKPPTVNLPRAPLYPIALVAEAIGQITGKEPMLTRDALKMASHRMFFSSAKAQEELGYAARPYREGLSDSLAWFRAAGYLQG
jgi:dihydroflavonol-4-reductase